MDNSTSELFLNIKNIEQLDTITSERVGAPKKESQKKKGMKGK